jgi:hypothetical protein
MKLSPGGGIRARERVRPTRQREANSRSERDRKHCAPEARKARAASPAHQKLDNGAEREYPAHQSGACDSEPKAGTQIANAPSASSSRPWIIHAGQYHIGMGGLFSSGVFW